MSDKEKLTNEFCEVLEVHDKCFQECKKLKLMCYFCGNKERLVIDFLDAYNDDDYILMNKIIGAMQCDIKSYKFVKSRKGVR